MQTAIDIFIHLDKHLNVWAEYLGIWLYLLLFLIIFCETGLIVTPFLPGDSLLFAVGALSALEGSPIDVVLVGILLCIAAILGDTVNYATGHYIGPRVFRSESSIFLNKNHLIRTNQFFEKHGGKTIIFARFMPIIRTFAPFVAGVGKMNYAKFALYNVVGGIVWVWSFLAAGYFFGNLPAVKHNFQFVILAIIGISLLPMLIEFWRSRKAKQSQPS
jgi:membrane-associated protein